MKRINPEKKRLLLEQYRQSLEFDGVFVLSPDWSVDVPLWPQSGAIDELVPKVLQEKLAAWQRIFDSNYKWREDSRPEGWLSSEAKSQWEQAVPDLVAELTSALDGNATLVIDLWPISPRKNNREFQKYQKEKKKESDRWRRVLKKAGITTSLRSPFYDASGNRLDWNSEDSSNET